MSGPDSPADACLDRTRAAVVNILVAVGVGIALSGAILGRRDRGEMPESAADLGRGMYLGLLALVVLGYGLRRVLGTRSALRDPDGRASRFYRAHVVGAAMGVLAIPLGFAYGWEVRPDLEAVAPFWVAALALGLLSWPRDGELEGLDSAAPGP